MMKQIFLGLVLGSLCLSAPTLAQQSPAELGFENKSLATQPWQSGKWTIFPSEAGSLQTDYVNSGDQALRVSTDNDGRVDIIYFLPNLPNKGELTYSAFVRFESIPNALSLDFSQNTEGRRVAYESLPVFGVETGKWQRYELTTSLYPDATAHFAGFSFTGPGEAYLDDIEIRLDGALLVSEPTVLETDLEFADGSGIIIDQLSEVQIENVSDFIMLWGYLKYYHPAAKLGEKHWDFEFFRVLPSILAAPDRSSGGQSLESWVQTLGPVDQPTSREPVFEGETALDLDINWLTTNSHYTSRFIEQMVSLSEAPLKNPANLYVSPGQSGQADFFSELSYDENLLDDDGYRLLLIARYWNMIQYWFPYRDVMDVSWPEILPDYVRRADEQDHKSNYLTVILELVAEIDDTHAQFYRGLIPPKGLCSIDVETRFIEGQLVVTDYRNGETESTSPFRIGDVVRTIDGLDVEQLQRSWQPFYPASNEAARLRNMGLNALRGECGDVALSLLRDDAVQTLTVTRTESDLRGVYRAPLYWAQANENVKILQNKIALIDLNSITEEEYVAAIKQDGLSGIVLDLRNYPKHLSAYNTAEHFIAQPTRFASFTTPDFSRPGRFRWITGPKLQPAVLGDYVDVPTVVLVDANTQSAAEFTAMALSQGPSVKIFGTQTAGADGNVSRIELPFGARTAISGIGVFYPDRSPAQRVGVKLDKIVTPTIKGVKEGRDEMLEEAILYIEQHGEN